MMTSLNNGVNNAETLRSPAMSELETARDSTVEPLEVDDVPVPRTKPRLGAILVALYVPLNIITLPPTTLTDP